MNRLHYLSLVVFFGGAFALGPVAVDPFLPAMPAIASALAVDTGAISISLGIFVLGSALGTVVCGPLADAVGRRPVLVAGLVLYTVASLGAMVAPSLEVLIAARLVQGFAAVSGRTIAVAVARDLFEREQAARLIAYVMTVGAVMPIIGPLIGSALLALWGWRAVFAFMALFGAVLTVAAVWFFREPLREGARRPLRPARVLQSYLVLGANYRFAAYTLCNALSTCGLFAFLSGGAVVIIDTLGHSPATFAYAFAFIMVCNMSGAFVGGRLVVSLGIDRVIAIGAGITCAAGVLMWALAALGVTHIAALVLPFAAYKAGDALIVPQATAGAIEPFADRAGMASSLVVLSRQSAGVVVTTLIGVLGHGTTLPMASAIAITGTLTAVVYWTLIRR